MNMSSKNKMDQMDQEDIAILNRIQRVDVPDYLLTRLTAKLDAVTTISRPQFAFGLVALLALVVLNGLYVANSTRSNNDTSSEVTEIASQFDLTTSNQLYYE